MLRIVINVSDKFEPGMGTIADFVADAARSMTVLANKLESDPELELSDELIKDLGLTLIELEGEY